MATRCLLVVLARRTSNSVDHFPGSILHRWLPGKAVMCTVNGAGCDGAFHSVASSPLIRAHASPPASDREASPTMSMDCHELAWLVCSENPRLSSVSITAWNGTAIIIAGPESRRQRHCNERRKVRQSAARASRPSDGLAYCVHQGRKRTRVAPI